MPDLYQIVNAALADTAARSGDHLACRPGCHQCCIGVFPISALDAETLKNALKTAPEQIAHAIYTRSQASRNRLTPNFPGNSATGELFTDPNHEEIFEAFANTEPCPILNPATGTCDLYAARPIQCRTFGPPIRDEDDHLTVCELCFVEAPAEEVARCEMDQSWRDLEDQTIDAATHRTGQSGPTLIAFALTGPHR